MPPSKRKQIAGGQVGFHVSTSGSVALSVDRAKELGCTTFQIFSSNPRIWRSPPIPAEAALAFREKRLNERFTRVTAHIPYLPNLASSDAGTMKLSRAGLKDALGRCELLGVDYLVVHLGTHQGQGAAVGVKNVAAACNEALATSDDDDKSMGAMKRTTIALENMAGMGTGIGSRFEEVASIIDGIGERERVGVCFDTCHAFVAGYDLSTKPGVEDTMGAFDKTIGIGRIRLVHLNDSKGVLGCRVDRHERVGQGHIGALGFRALLHYKNIGALPLVMEPSDQDVAHAEDIEFVRRLAGNSKIVQKIVPRRAPGQTSPYL